MNILVPDEIDDKYQDDQLIKDLNEDMLKDINHAEYVGVSNIQPIQDYYNFKITERLEILHEQSCIALASQKEMIIDAINSLPEDYKKILILTYYEGLTPAEIEQVLYIPEEKIIFWLEKALDEIRAIKWKFKNR